MHYSSGQLILICSDGHTRRVHGEEPHGCGEYVYHRDRCLIPSGSSPRGRGKRDRHMDSLSSWRLIPAWAGKTRSGCQRSTRQPAHPRVGGENNVNLNHKAIHMGSSPRGRGKPKVPDRTSAITRLIPAWAGKTHARRRLPRRNRAHPRVGGENISGLFIDAAAKGSSPRGRGKPLIVS